MNKTDSTIGSLEQLVNSLTSNVSVVNHYGIDGQQYFHMISDIVDSSNTISQSPQGSVISTSNGNAKYSSIIGQSIPLSFQISNLCEGKTTQTYTDSSTNKSKQLKYSASNSFSATKNVEMALETLSSSRLVETDSSLNMSHTNVHNSQVDSSIKSETGFGIEAKYYDLDIKTIGDTVVQIKKDNETSIDGQINENAHLKMFSHNKIEQSINGAIQKNDVECINYMLPADGQIEISITDNVEKNSCKILLGSNGIAKITASKEIDIEAPTVNIKGQTMNQTFKTMALKAQTMNITGSSGDCKIKNVSLLNHKHLETQSGDVVKPQPSKTATTSN